MSGGGGDGGGGDTNNRYVCHIRHFHNFHSASPSAPIEIELMLILALVPFSVALRRSIADTVPAKNHNPPTERELPFLLRLGVARPTADERIYF